MEIYYIGGSPCSGKSTVAEALAQHYELCYFKADDHLEAFTARGAAEGLPVCQRIQRMSADETWMRPPQVQCREELDYYAEIFPFVREKLAGMHAPRVIAEGAAFLPCLMTDTAHYIAITPSWEFQFSWYSQRPGCPISCRTAPTRALPSPTGWSVMHSSPRKSAASAGSSVCLIC